MRRDPFGALLVVLVILGFGIIVWATRYPESELLKKAEEWPVAGPLVSRFRDRYVPSRPVQTTPKEVAVPVGPEVGEREEPSALRSGQGVVWVKVGTPLRSEADARAPVVERVSEVSRFPVVERAGDWYRVVSQDRVVWVLLPAYGEGGNPPLGSEPAQPSPLAGRPPDAQIQALAVGLLRRHPEPSRLGGYQFFTDVEDQSLVAMLNGVAGNVEREYAARYAIEPIDRPRESIVLFAREHDYRLLQNSFERLAGLPALGLVSRGVVAVYVGVRDGEEVAATLVHELVHLLNRRALGPALPPWLDEGLADDLSYSRIEPSGGLVPGELGGSSVDLGSIRIWQGGRAAAMELRRALLADRAVPLRELASLDWRSFVDPESRLNYPQSALFVRYLVESEADLRRGFHAYLESIAAGESVAAEALLHHLGRSWAELEAGFHEWALGRLADLRDESPAAS